MKIFLVKFNQNTTVFLKQNISYNTTFLLKTFLLSTRHLEKSIKVKCQN